MPINLLEVAMKIYKPEEYGYKIRGNGTRDMNGDGLKDIDCSGMVSSVLRAARANEENLLLHAVREEFR